jgi:hypothetical protein
MVPDRKNYEPFIIDYLDGNLSQDQIFELFDFLKANPDIKKEFEEIYSFYNKISEGSYKYKNELKKSPSDLSESQFEILCVASSENDLDSEQEKELNEIITSDPQREKTYDLIKGIKLAPPDIKFRYKNKLKKTTFRQKVYRYSVIGMSAAAAVLILFFILTGPTPKNRDNQTASAINDTAIIKTGVLITRLTPEDVPESDNINNAVKIAKHPPPEVRNHKIVAVTASTSKNLITAGPDSNAINMDRMRSNISKITTFKNPGITEAAPGAELIAINTTVGDLAIPQDQDRFNKFIARVFRDHILKADSTEHGNLKGYEIADAGIRGLNKLLGWQMSLEKERNANGVVESVYFSSRLLKFNAPVRKASPSL